MIPKGWKRAPALREMLLERVPEQWLDQCQGNDQPVEEYKSDFSQFGEKVGTCSFTI